MSSCWGRGLGVFAISALLLLGLHQGGLALTAAAAETVAEGFVVIPSGHFVMGSPESEPSALSYEHPQHQVMFTRSLVMSATEVTQAQWISLMGTSPGYYAACRDCPIENVSWFDAIAYCNALSAREQLMPAYAVAGSLVTWNQEAAGYRLPTEAEWEYACRAGTTTPFNTGECLDTDQANYNGYKPAPGCPDGLYRGEPIGVASFDPNPWGLFDMHGNGYEWCWDWNGLYAADPVTDPTGPSAGTGRIARGGCWAAAAGNCRSAARQRLDPATRLDYVGFRVVRSLARKEQHE